MTFVTSITHTHTPSAKRDGATGGRDLMPLEDAIAVVGSFAHFLERKENVLLDKSLGRRLAAPVFARLDVPRFDVSAMDGYALGGDGQPNGRYGYLLSSNMRAGSSPVPLGLGESARIATGAPVPPGADRVVLYEHAKEDGEGLWLVDGPVQVGANIRRRGEDVRQGQILLSKGDLINSRRIALLAAQGFTSIEVACLPRVAVISSGNELRQPGEALGEAAIYDSNRPMLVALAKMWGASVIDGGWCRDDCRLLSEKVSILAATCDVVVVSGGASIGDADTTAAALRLAGAEVLELKVAVKPGKPAIIGRIGKTVLLGVPRNPTAAFASWFTLGRTILSKAAGYSLDVLSGPQVQTVSELRRAPGRAELIPCRLLGHAAEDGVEFVARAGSARLATLSAADGFAFVESSRGSICSGDLVTFLAFGSRSCG